MRTRI